MTPGRSSRVTRKYLERWTSTRVTIEGHADSRGTSEYNLALGETPRGRGEGLSYRSRYRRESHVGCEQRRREPAVHPGGRGPAGSGTAGATSSSRLSKRDVGVGLRPAPHLDRADQLGFSPGAGRAPIRRQWPPPLCVGQAPRRSASPPRYSSPPPAAPPLAPASSSDRCVRDPQTRHGFQA